MIIKVCGIKTEENIRSISEIDIDMIGLNFYEPSKRYVDKSVIPQWYDMLPEKISRVGVFVNMDEDDLLDFVDEYRLDYAQLHGNESIEYVKEIHKSIPVIKVFRVGKEFDIRSTADFSFVDYILFDTDNKSFGGSGQQFDWEILSDYPLDIPFLISGGIGPLDAIKIKKINHPNFGGIDINSKFESMPGIKDMKLVSQFVQDISKTN